MRNYGSDQPTLQLLSSTQGIIEKRLEEDLKLEISRVSQKFMHYSIIRFWTVSVGSSNRRCPPCFDKCAMAPWLSHSAVDEIGILKIPQESPKAGH